MILFSAFSLIEGSQAPVQCFVYVLGNLVILALAMYKCHTMGLLPTYASDWLAFVEPPQVSLLCSTLKNSITSPHVRLCKDSVVGIHCSRYLV